MGNGAKTKCDVDITARLDPSKPGGIAWTPDYRTSPPENGKQDGHTYRVKAKGEVDFTFSLRDQTGLGLTFKQNGSDAIHVAQGEMCPVPPGDGNGEFVIDPKTHERKAGMTDLNTIPGPFSYQLNFDSSDGNKSYDPIIIND